MKYFFSSILLLCLFNNGQGQGLIFNMNAGYALGCSFDAFHDTANYYSASVKQGVKYSLDAGYKIDSNFSVNLSLQYQNTTLHADARYNGTKLSPDLQMALLWIQVGGTSHLPVHHLDLFFGTYVGVGIYDFSNVPSSSKEAPVRLAWSFRGGLVYFITKHVGINLRSDALFSMDPLTKQFTPPGLSEGETGYNSFFQFSFSSGVTIDLTRNVRKRKG